jgi:hypothetical protein
VQSRSSASREYLHRLAATDITKFLAVSSVALYGILFLAYRRYYEAVDVTPEDAGVTNTFVLVRSPGFIVVTVAVATILFGLLISDGAISDADRPGHENLRALGRVLLSAAAAYYFYSLSPRPLLS